MRQKLFLIPLLATLVACSHERDKYLNPEIAPCAIKLARKISVDIPAVDPDGGFVLVSCESFKIRPIDALNQMCSHFGQAAGKIGQQPEKDIRDTIERTAEGLAIRTMLIDAAIAAGIRVPATQIDSALQDRYNSAGGKDKFMTYLQENGIPMEDVIRNLRSFLLTDKFEHHLYAQLPPITEADIIKAYQQPKTATVRSILFSTENKTEDEKAQIRKKTEEVLRKARNGTDFAELAIIYNEDAVTRKNFGVYQNFQPGEMLKPFEDAAFSLPLDAISDIIETEHGYYLIQVLDQVNEPRPLNEVREELRQTLLARRQKKTFDQFVEQAKRQEGYQFQKLP